MVRLAADKIDAGGEARTEVSMCKLYTANIAQETIDTTLQFCGGNGHSKRPPYL